MSRINCLLAIFPVILLLLLYNPLTFYCAQGESFVQGEWTLISQNIGGHFEKLFFVSETQGWAVGWEQLILHTDDGGVTWLKQMRKESAGGNISVFFLNQNQGWVANSGGFIFHTENGGKNWEKQKIADAAYLTDIFFVNSKEGWALGTQRVNLQDQDIIWHTNDGGQHWQRKKNFQEWLFLSSLYFLSPQEGWAAGGSNIMHTRDGGITWQQQKVENTFLQDIRFLTPQEGWVVGLRFVGRGINQRRGIFSDKVGLILHTSDGGEKWEISYEGRQRQEEIWGVAVLNTSEVIVVGRAAPENTPIWHGVILRSEDGGKTWQRQETPEPLFDVFFVNEKVGWAAGYHNILLQTKDGGRTWSPLLYRTYRYTDVFFTKRGEGFILGSSDQHPRAATGKTVLLNSNDFGHSFSPCSALHLAPQSMAFVNEQEGIAVGWGWAKTEDSGLTWKEMEHDGPMQRDVFFVTEKIGYSVGNSGSIYKTTDSFESFKRQKTETEEDLYAVHFVDTQKGWAVGGTWNQGVILNTEDGGQQWKRKPYEVPLRGVFFFDKDLGWAVGYRGNILKTENGGKRWDEQPSETANKLFDVFFANEKEGWAVGENGTILHTINGGRSWLKQESPTSVDLYRISPTYRGGLVIVGDWSTILYAAYPPLDLSVNLADKKPALWGQLKTQLLPNYPNPFNPETWIPYMLSQETEVSLFIYNVKGELVRSFYLGKRHVGRYIDKEQAIHWDGKNQLSEKVSSGVYFYRLQAGDEKQNRKMLLLK